MKTLLLSEDGGSSLQILKNILVKTFYNLCSDFDKNSLKEHPNEYDKITSGKYWRKVGYDPDMVDLKTEIADILSKGDFVFWHIDADEVWTDKKEETRKTFTTKIIEPISELAGLTKEETISQLVLVNPFFEIEAWLFPFLYKITPELGNEYQNLVTTSPVDIGDIKDKISCKDKHNLQLSENLSISKLQTFSPSFSLFKNTLSGNEKLIQALPRRI